MSSRNKSSRKKSSRKNDVTSREDGGTAPYPWPGRSDTEEDTAPYPWPGRSDTEEENAFNPDPPCERSLTHVHLAFDVARDDVDENTDCVKRGGRLYIQLPAPERKLRLIVVYHYEKDATNNPQKWDGLTSPRVVAMGDYPVLVPGAFSLRITEEVPREDLRPIAVRDIETWRDWWKAYRTYVESLGDGVWGVGEAATAGDKNT